MLCLISFIYLYCFFFFLFFFSSRRRHTRLKRDWSSDVCSSDLGIRGADAGVAELTRPVIQPGSPGPPRRASPSLDPSYDDRLGRSRALPNRDTARVSKIGRASCRERAEVAVVGRGVERNRGQRW